MGLLPVAAESCSAELWRFDMFDFDYRNIIALRLPRDDNWPFSGWTGRHDGKLGMVGEFHRFALARLRQIKPSRAATKPDRVEAVLIGGYPRLQSEP